MEYTDEQIVKMYKTLPEDLKSAIFSVEMTRVIEDIGRKYNLYVDQTGKLGNETGMVMLGVTSPQNYISTLARRLNIDKEIARKIAEEVNSQIFAKVRDSLKKVHGIEETPPAVPPFGESALSPLQGDGRGEVKSGEAEVKPKDDLQKEREEIMRHLETEPVEIKLPAIMRGVKTPPPPSPAPAENPFEAKLAGEPSKMPIQESEHKYPDKDPYREPVE